MNPQEPLPTPPPGPAAELTSCTRLVTQAATASRPPKARRSQAVRCACTRSAAPAGPPGAGPSRRSRLPAETAVCACRGPALVPRVSPSPYTGPASAIRKGGAQSGAERMRSPDRPAPVRLLQPRRPWSALFPRRRLKTPLGAMGDGSASDGPAVAVVAYGCYRIMRTGATRHAQCRFRARRVAVRTPCWRRRP